ncbi:hypothetical protein N9L47_00950 [Rhodobacteraceae bacterium]|nr:hypothetical protein [Paracoccaceae bacterium]
MTKRSNAENERLERTERLFQLSHRTGDGVSPHLEQSKTIAGMPLGNSTMRSVLSTLREFILGLSQQDGFRSRIRASDAEYFTLSRRDETEARATPPRPVPSVNQAKRALGLMPSATPQQKRDKASLPYFA